MASAKVKAIYADAKSVLKGLMEGVPGNHLFIMAAGLSYYFIIGLFPGLVLLSVAASYLPFADATSHTFTLLSSFIPHSQMHVISRFMDQAVVPNRDALLTVGALGTLWAVSSAFDSLTSAISISYEAPDNRPVWITRPIAIGLTVSVGLLFLLAFAVLTVGPHFGNWLAERLGVSEVVAVIWPYVRWVTAVVAAVVSVEVLYFISPRKKQRFLETLPGAILAIAGWLALTYFLGFYFRSRSAQSNLYGSLAGGIAFMVWLYWAGFLVLLGAQLNTEIERVRRRKRDITPQATPIRPEGNSPAPLLDEQRRLQEVQAEESRRPGTGGN